jgi:hypothetical protein
MKDHTTLDQASFFSILFVVAALVFVGCATSKKMDWNSRVGAFTYDQAIAELGPPDKQAKLSDGKTVAEWITHHSGGGSLTIGTGVSGGHAGVGVGQTIGSGGQNHGLRLTFGTDGRLAAWSRN